MINTDWETSLTARYQTDSQTIKCIQYPSLKFFWVFKVFFTKSPYDNGHFHPNVIHLTAVEIQGVAPKTRVPHGGQKQQQNNMLSSTKKIRQKNKNKTSPHNCTWVTWTGKSVTLLFHFSLLFVLWSDKKMNSFACGKSGNKDQSPVQNPKSHLWGCCCAVSFGFLGQTALPLCKWFHYGPQLLTSLRHTLAFPDYLTADILALASINMLSSIPLDIHMATQNPWVSLHTTRNTHS